jgi:phosphate transport system protein
MGGLAEAILQKALRSVWERDPALGAEVKLDDLEIDRLDVEIDEAVLKVLALRSPVAADLRRVIAIKTMSNDVERVGDLARNIAKSAVRLAAKPPIEIPSEFEKLADDSRRLLRKSLDCFARCDTEAARQVLEEDDVIDLEEDAVIRQAMEAIASHPEASSQEVDLILIAKNLERVADHATNIAEDVLLIAEARNVKHAEKLSH